MDRLLAAPRGRAAQMNAGALAAKGELLWFLHADSRVSAATAEALLAAARPVVRPVVRWGRCDVRLSGAIRCCG